MLHNDRRSVSLRRKTCEGIRDAKKQFEASVGFPVDFDLFIRNMLHLWEHRVLISGYSDYYDSEKYNYEKNKEKGD